MLVITAMLGLAMQAADVKPVESMDGPAAWTRLKTLVGEWQADSSTGKLHVSYSLIAGGATLVEQDRSEDRPEMLTAYHLDGKRLLLTHYCMAGNQPRTEARSFDSGTGEIQFRFLDATNLTTPAAGHMRNLVLRVGNDGSLASDWQFFQDGRLKMTETARYTRVR
jgi:hypothetical protein